ncbi:MAG: phage holin family protein [Acetobacter sp.]|nr:phage holin family protein [Acetobacter sp.]MBO6035851.1 phage holin family protein [Acetobacter sp.]MBO6043799.1 phage holin family protein [Acetobacter sp.]MBO6085288.1 phage holin family protein [Acetobacter sp.]MBO6091383.1 phage holin family protein [Acetobacter sp.]
MHIFDLFKSFFVAQSKVMQYMAVRYGRQIAFLVIAAVFGMFALITGHWLVWTILVFALHMGQIWATIVVLGMDVFAAMICLLLGTRSYLTAGEVKARIDRDRYLTQMRDSMSFSSVVSFLLSALGRDRLRMIWEIAQRMKK